VPFAKIGGLELYYTCQGDGDPIILLHGIFGKGEDWIENNYHHYLHNRTLILIDLLGHGRSTKSTNIVDYFPNNQVMQIQAVIDQENIDTAKVMGYSYGGRMAIAYAIKYPGKTQELIVGGMHPYPVRNVFNQIRKRQQIIAEGMSSWINHLTSAGVQLDDYTRDVLLSNDPKALNTMDESILQWQGFGDTLKKLQASSIHQIFYAGERDNSYLPKAKEYCDSAKQAEFIQISDGNHFTAFSDASQWARSVKPIMI